MDMSFADRFANIIRQYHEGLLCRQDVYHCLIDALLDAHTRTGRLVSVRDLNMADSISRNLPVVA
jgi:hypothetical protein